MKALLDTNLFYYLAGLEKSPYQPEKIEASMSTFSEIFVSELTLLEILGKQKKDHNRILRVINFIANRRIKVHQMLPDNETIAKKMNDKGMEYADNYFKLEETALQLKIQIELDFYVYWSASLSGLTLMLLFRIHTSISESGKTAVLSQFNFIAEKMKQRDGAFQKNVRLHLGEFYRDSNYNLDARVNRWFLDIVRQMVRVFEFSLQGLNYLEMIENGPEEANRIILDLPKRSELAASIDKKLSARHVKIVTSRYLRLFDDVLQSFESNSKSDVDGYLLKFNIIVFRKWFTTEGFKIRKNDIFDSILFKYMKDYDLLTFDSDMRKRIAEIDKNRHATLEIFVANCA